MLTLIENKNEIAGLRSKMLSILDKFKSDSTVKLVGNAGGGENHKINFSRELGIWWSPNKKINENHYWNSYGIGGTRQSYTDDYFTEINYEVEGINGRVAGNWAKDENRKIFLLHSGKMGGGKVGFTKDFFYTNFKGKPIEVNVNGNHKKFVPVGSLQDKLFAYQLAVFVKEVFRIKSIDLNNISSKRTAGNIHSPNFKNEFFGLRKTYSLPETVSANCNHGLIVKHLAEFFDSMKIRYGNDQKKDMFLINKAGRQSCLIEIKTSLSLQSVYTAIGQLKLNSLISKEPKLIFVSPKEINNELVRDLKRLDIEVVTYEFKKGIPFFYNLEKLIPVIK